MLRVLVIFPSRYLNFTFENKFYIWEWIRSLQFSWGKWHQFLLSPNPSLTNSCPSLYWFVFSLRHWACPVLPYIFLYISVIALLDAAKRALQPEGIMSENYTRLQVIVCWVTNKGYVYFFFFLVGAVLCIVCVRGIFGLHPVDTSSTFTSNSSCDNPNCP